MSSFLLTAPINWPEVLGDRLSVVRHVEAENRRAEPDERRHREKDLGDFLARRPLVAPRRHLGLLWADCRCRLLNAEGRMPITWQILIFGIWAWELGLERKK